MALASSNKLENRVNSCDDDASPSSFTFETISKQARGVLKCFEEAVKIENTNVTLWIEYGLVAYQFHSHASRELKKLSTTSSGEPSAVSSSMDDSAKAGLQKCRDEMLGVARKAYLSATSKPSRDAGNDGVAASEDSEEEWLRHYMLGKTAEKNKGGKPETYFEHYKQAAIHLHNDNAKYPKKIGYTPPTYSLEAMEVFFRLNASVLKLLLESCPSKEEEMKVLE